MSTRSGKDVLLRWQIPWRSGIGRRFCCTGVSKSDVEDEESDIPWVRHYDMGLFGGGGGGE